MLGIRVKRRIPIVILVLGGLIPFAILLYFIIAPDPVRLRWQFDKGKVWRYECTTHTSATSSICIYSMTVLDIDSAGSATIQCKCEAASTKSLGWDYDSRRDPGEPQHPVALAFFRRLDKTMTIRMDPLGHVIDLKGTETRTETDRPFVDSMVYPDYLATDGSLVWYLPMPERPVGRGDSWTCDLKDGGSTMPHESRFSRTFRLTSLTREEARISMFDSFGSGYEDFYAKARLKPERTTTARFSAHQGQLLTYVSEQRYPGRSAGDVIVLSQEVRLLPTDRP
jgi:hypothetical protein